MRARMAKPVDAKDLKSLAFMACGFESRFGHQQQAKSPNPKPGIRKAENTLALTALTPTGVICSCAGQAGKRIRNLPIFQNLACYTSGRRSSGHYRLPLSASERQFRGILLWFFSEDRAAAEAPSRPGGPPIAHNICPRSRCAGRCRNSGRADAVRKSRSKSKRSSNRKRPKGGCAPLGRLSIGFKQTDPKQAFLLTRLQTS